MTQVSLSTMWSKGKYDHMAEFVQEAYEFGFTYVELNSILTPERLKELLEVKGLKVSSIHAPCPNGRTSQGTEASALSLSSLNEDERQEAVKFAKATIELASEINAKFVIIHAGRVEMDFGLADQLQQLHEQGLAGSSEYHEIKTRIIAARSFWACPHVDAAKESLRGLADFASDKGVKLGIENRVHFYEIPSFIEEMEQILEEFPPDLVGYWHDVGHAEIQSRLGFTPHQGWFSRLSERIMGIHLHDVLRIQDHRAPGTGNVDWDFIAANLPQEALRVCEIGEWNNREDARQAVSFLQSKGIL